MIERAATRLESSSPESLAKPKVMRRPAQFSGSLSPAITDIDITPPPAPSRSVAAIATGQPAQESLPWQHDGRFALALLAVVLFVNVAVYFTLTMVSHHSTAQGTHAQSTHGKNDSGIHILDDSRSVAVVEP
jgi:hypothetical protein